MVACFIYADRIFSATNDVTAFQIGHRSYTPVFFQRLVGGFGVLRGDTLGAAYFL
jgi:hypothetical protein